MVNLVPFDITSVTLTVVIMLLRRRMMGKGASYFLCLSFQVWEEKYTCTFHTKYDNLEAAKLVLKEIFSSGSSHRFADIKI